MKGFNLDFSLFGVLPSLHSHDSMLLGDYESKIKFKPFVTRYRQARWQADKQSDRQTEKEAETKSKQQMFSSHFIRPHSFFVCVCIAFGWLVYIQICLFSIVFHNFPQ